MRRIDQQIDLLGLEEIGKPLAAAETAAAGGNRLRQPGLPCGRQARAATSQSARAASAAASCRASVVPPRIRMRVCPWLTISLLVRQRWLTIIGLGEDGLAGLGDEAKRLIAAAPVVFGGTRHLELVHAR